MQRKLKKEIKRLKDNFEGLLFFDELSKVVYATDASAYREIPFGVAHPKTKNDLQKLIEFAKATNITLIPRGAGTSLAGQVVGDGLVIDFSRYFNRVLEVNADEKWVRVEPGVILDELNNRLKVHNLFFAPETSTSNRCTIGGMVGNNSCGSHSLVYGSTREHLLETTLLLANNEEVLLKDLSKEEFEVKTQEDSLEGLIYKSIP